MSFQAASDGLLGIYAHKYAVSAMSDLSTPRPMFFRPNGSPVHLLDIYANTSVFLLCNGPSFREVESSLFRKRGIMTFGLNNGAHEFVPQLWAAVDHPARFARSVWADPTILKFIPLDNAEKPIWDAKAGCYSQEKASSFPNVLCVRRNERFDPFTWLKEETVNCGNDPRFGGPVSVMLFSLRICYLLGFRQVFLVACDFNMRLERPYWFDGTYDQASVEFNNKVYRKLAQLFKLLKPQFDAAGFSVLNTNRKSQLTVFPFTDLNHAICGSSVATPSATRGV